MSARDVVIMVAVLGAAVLAARSRLVQEAQAATTAKTELDRIMERAKRGLA